MKTLLKNCFRVKPWRKFWKNLKKIKPSLPPILLNLSLNKMPSHLESYSNKSKEESNLTLNKILSLTIEYPKDLWLKMTSLKELGHYLLIEKINLYGNILTLYRYLRMKSKNTLNL